jgi:hypothetical protein
MKWYEHPNLLEPFNTVPFTGAYKVESSDEWSLRTGVGNYSPEHCILIARPIEDMTDEEVLLTPSWKEITCMDGNKPRSQTVRRQIDEELDGNCLNMQDAIYLISIGVWAWDTDRVEFRKEQSDE